MEIPVLISWHTLSAPVSTYVAQFVKAYPDPSTTVPAHVETGADKVCHDINTGISIHCACFGQRTLQRVLRGLCEVPISAMVGNWNELHCEDGKQSPPKTGRVAAAALSRVLQNVYQYLRLQYFGREGYRIGR